MKVAAMRKMSLTFLYVFSTNGALRGRARVRIATSHRITGECDRHTQFNLSGRRCRPLVMYSTVHMRPSASHKAYTYTSYTQQIPS